MALLFYLTVEKKAKVTSIGFLRSESFSKDGICSHTIVYTLSLEPEPKKRRKKKK